MLKQEIARSTHDIAFAGFFGAANVTSVRIMFHAKPKCSVLVSFIVRLVWFYIFRAANSTTFFLLLVFHLHFK